MLYLYRYSIFEDDIVQKIFQDNKFLHKETNTNLINEKLDVQIYISQRPKSKSTNN